MQSRTLVPLLPFSSGSSWLQGGPASLRSLSTLNGRKVADCIDRRADNYPRGLGHVEHQSNCHRTLFGVIAAGLSATAFARDFISYIPIPSGFTVPNACNGELIAIQSGEVKLLNNLRLDKKGQVHITVRQQLIGVTGIGLDTGADYRILGNTTELNPYPQDFTTVFDADGPGGPRIVFQLAVSTQLVPIGGDDGQRVSIHVLVHYSTDASGEIKAAVNGASTTCGQ
jgi:hypothetical protein